MPHSQPHDVEPRRGTGVRYSALLRYMCGPFLILEAASSDGPPVTPELYHQGKCYSRAQPEYTWLAAPCTCALTWLLYILLDIPRSQTHVTQEKCAHACADSF